MPPTNASNWTESEDEALQYGLKKFPHTLDKNERWTSIASCVPTRSKKECVARFKEIRAALMATASASGDGGRADRSGEKGEEKAEEKASTKQTSEGSRDAGAASGGAGAGAGATVGAGVSDEGKAKHTKQEPAKLHTKDERKHDQSKSPSQPSVIQSTSPGTPSLLIPGQAVNRSNHRRASGGAGSTSSDGGNDDNGGISTTKRNTSSGRKRNEKKTSTKTAQGSNANVNTNDEINTANDDAGNDQGAATAAKKKRNRRKKKKGGGDNKAEPPSSNDQQSSNQPRQKEGDGSQNKSNNNKKKKNKNKQNERNGDKNKRRGKFAWRDEVPQGAVDPISLDPLVELPYPPFALVATEPYDVVSEWPVSPEEERRLALGSTGGGAATSGGGSDKASEQKRIAERELDVIREQWGDAVAASASAFSGGADADVSDNGDNGKTDDSKQATSTAETTGRRYYHLFDGQVLAYYLVSQLQFIDPLNRRDLTRAELKNLDAYLKRHRLGKAGVTEAYDARGLTVSSAGVAGQTDEGRAEILQQEARTLLGSLFSGDSHAQGSAAAHRQQLEARARATPRFENEFQRHYQESELRQQQGGRGRGRGRGRGNSGGDRRNQQAPFDHPEDPGVYAAEEGGMLIIDDDYNPGMRGGLEAASHSALRHEEQTGRGDGSNAAAGPNTFYSASHIANQYGHASRVRADNFPALQTTPAGEASSSAESTPVPTSKAPSKPKGPSKSLMKISKIVQKTDPKELAKQKQATEAARKRAAMANLSFQVPGTQGTGVGGDGIGAAVSAVNSTTAAASEGGTTHAPSEGQLQRNRAMASALGVKPSTMRNNFNSGWARPTVANIELDEFGNELNAAQYSDALIMEAKEKMAELLKLERRWKTFLADDKSSSQPLRAMPRDLRKFVHEYSDHWRLHTESFDPEPRRYIHCTKMRDTSAPHPLLSEAARKWKGPGTGAPALPPIRPASQGADGVHQTHPSTLIAGQGVAPATGSATPREFTVTEERKPLKLEPRTIPPGQVLAEEAGAKASGKDDWEDHEPAERFSSLALGEKERTKLTLAPRTKPLELPPYQQNLTKTYDVAKARERIEREKKEKLEKQRKKEEKKKNILASAFASDSEDEDDGSDSSDWGEDQDAVFAGSDGEEW